MKKIGVLLQTRPVARLIELLSVFGAALAIVALFLGPADRLVYNQLVLWIANIVMLALIWTGIRLRGERWDSLGLRFGRITFKNTFRTFLLSLAAFAAGLAGFLAGTVLMANIGGAPVQADMGGYDFLQGRPGMLVLTLAGVYVASSFGEEVLYRGFLINRLAAFFPGEKTGRWIAVVASAIIFGFAHYRWGTTGIVQTAFMGLALGICYLRMKRNLWILVLAHAYMDTILMLQLYSAGS